MRGKAEGEASEREGGWERKMEGDGATGRDRVCMRKEDEGRKLIEGKKKGRNSWLGRRKGVTEERREVREGRKKTNQVMRREETEKRTKRKGR